MAGRILTAAIVLAAMAGGAAPARADNPFCGVRVQGPALAGNDMNAYTIGNKCSQTLGLAVTVYGRRTRCRNVRPRRYATFLSAGADVDWRIVLCGRGSDGVGARPRTRARCGVPNDTWFENGVEVYVVFNRCRRTHGFAVYLPGVRRYTSVRCIHIGPRSFGYFTDKWPERYWRLRYC